MGCIISYTIYRVSIRSLLFLHKLNLPGADSETQQQRNLLGILRASELLPRLRVLVVVVVVVGKQVRVCSEAHPAFERTKRCVGWVSGAGGKGK